MCIPNYFSTRLKFEQLPVLKCEISKIFTSLYESERPYIEKLEFETRYKEKRKIYRHHGTDLSTKEESM